MKIFWIISFDSLAICKLLSRQEESRASGFCLLIELAKYHFIISAAQVSEKAVNLSSVDLFSFISQQIFQEFPI